MKSFSNKLLFSVLFLLLSFSVFAEEAEDDGEWFWNKPIAEITFEGLKTVKKSDLTGVISHFIGLPFDEDTYTDILDRLSAMDLFEELEQRRLLFLISVFPEMFRFVTVN